MDNIINLDSVEQYNNCVGMETLHPLVTVVDLNHATKSFGNVRLNYGLFAIFLKLEKSCAIKYYGRKTYDYQEGSVVCFAPGQVIDIESDKDHPQSNVFGLLFHPELLRGTSLAKAIHRYTFFSYSTTEALHLSERERDVVTDCLQFIANELERGVDNHTKKILINEIELLLNYCMRFYERQFITRNAVNCDIVARFEELLNNYFEDNNAEINGLPSVKYFADKLCLSPNYFGDLLKKETGKSPQEYIQLKLINEAKQRLTDDNKPMSQIAYSLGFQYPQHLTRLFKKATGMTPGQYRQTEA